MLFFEAVTRQANKKDHRVCGDFYKVLRFADVSYYLICDGIGSGIYARLAAIGCCDRLTELISSQLGFQKACEMVAASMHRARTEAVPFSAFTAVKVLKNGQATIYSYEAPAPIVSRNQLIQVPKQHFYTTGYEIIAEASTILEDGDYIMLFSDGVSQAGLGRDYHLGWGSQSVAEFIKRQDDEDAGALLDAILARCQEISGGRHEDDTTVMMIKARPAKQVTLFTGPPTNKERDADLVLRYVNAPDPKIICGSTTTDILARILDRPVDVVHQGMGFLSPPEYRFHDAVITTEGAVVLNQVLNIVDQKLPKNLTSTPERISHYLQQADVIHFVVGDAKNEAHDALVFKQLGVKPRAQVVRQLDEKLTEMGKLVNIEHL